MPDTSLGQILKSVNTSKLNKTLGGYDQSFQQFVDPQGNVYTPTYGGEMNNVIGYSGTQNIGNDLVNVNYDANGNVVSATGQPTTMNGQQVVADYSPTGQATYRAYAGPESALQGFAPVLGMAAAAFGIPGIIGNAMGLTGSAAAAAGGAVLGGGMAGITGQNILKGAAIGGLGGYAGSELGNYLNDGYNYNGPDATNPTLADLNGTSQLTGLDQYQVPISDFSGTGGGGVDNGLGYEPPSNTKGYYDETTGQFIQDQNGGLQGPLTNDTSGTNLSSMDNYNYDQNTGKWTMPDGTVVDTMLTNKPGNNGGDLLSNASKVGAAGGASSLLGDLPTTGNKVLDSAIVSGLAGTLGNVVTNNSISNAAASQAAAAQQAGATLKDIYNQQLGFVQPYQQVGQQGLNAITANMPYLQHQFNAQDLAAGLAPNYDFMLQQGQMANQRAANVGGGAIGGNALQGLNKFTQDYAGNAYQNAFNNYQTQRSNIYNTLSNIASLGQTANQQAIGAGTNYGQQQTNLTTGLAATQAGANVAQAQNTSNTLNNLANNITLASLLGQKQAVTP